MEGLPAISWRYASLIILGASLGGACSEDASSVPITREVVLDQCTNTPEVVFFVDSERPFSTPEEALQAQVEASALLPEDADYEFTSFGESTRTVAFGRDSSTKFGVAELIRIENRWTMTEAVICSTAN